MLTINTRNILSTYYAANEAEIAYGMEWYRIANGIAKRIAEVHGLRVQVVAGVMSALSPNNKWHRNVMDAENLIATWAAGGTINDVKVSTYGANKAKAWRILQGETPETAFSKAPKTRAFYRLIADPTSDSVVIDGHATNIWNGEYAALGVTKSLTPKQYEAIALDYRLAAEHVGIDAHQMQAVTWVAYRRIHLGLED